MVGEVVGQGRARLDVAGRDGGHARLELACPGRKAAVEHQDLALADVPEEPPQPRRTARHVLVVGDDRARAR